MIVDNRMCFIEVIDTAEQGEHPTQSLVRSQLTPARFQRNMLPCATNGSSILYPSSTFSLLPAHPPLREGEGFILIYSVTLRSTFDHLGTFFNSIQRVRQGSVFMLVGNKCDKSQEREVSREEGAQLARSFGCDFLETSAKTAVNVERLFTTLVRLLRQTKQVEQGTPGPSRQTDKEKKRRCIIM